MGQLQRKGAFLQEHFNTNPNFKENESTAECINFEKRNKRG